MDNTRENYKIFLKKELELNPLSEEYENALNQYIVDDWDGSFYRDFLDWLNEGE